MPPNAPSERPQTTPGMLALVVVLCSMGALSHVMFVVLAFRVKIHVQYARTLKIHVQYARTLKIHVQYARTLKIHVQYARTLKIHVQYVRLWRIRYVRGLRLGSRPG